MVDADRGIAGSTLGKRTKGLRVYRRDVNSLDIRDMQYPIRLLMVCDKPPCERGGGYFGGRDSASAWGWRA
jgi:hypothetical protein